MDIRRLEYVNSHYRRDPAAGVSIENDAVIYKSRGRLGEMFP